MRKPEMVQAVCEYLAAHPKGERKKPISPRIVRHVLDAYYEVMTTALTHGEPIEVYGLFTIWPQIGMFHSQTVYSHTEKKVIKKPHLKMQLRIHVRKGKHWIDKFEKLRKTFVEVVDLEEAVKRGKVRLRTRFRESAKTRYDKRNRRVPLVQDGMQRAATLLPAAWNAALRIDGEETGD